MSNDYTLNDAKRVCREAILLSREEPELSTQVRFFHSTGTCSYLTKPRDPSTTKDFHIFKSNPYIFDSKAALLLLVYLMYLIWQSWSSSQVVEVQTHRCLQRHLPQLKKTFQYLSVYFTHVKFRYANLNNCLLYFLSAFCGSYCSFTVC